MDFFKKHTRLAVTLKIFLSLLLIGGGVLLWLCGLAVILFGFIQQMALWIVWTLLLLTGVWATLCWIWKIFRKVRIVSGLAAGVLLATLIAIPTYHWLTVERFHQMSDEIFWWKYDPWIENTLAVSVNAPEEYKISGKLPRIDGAYALYPVYAGMVQALYDRKQYEKNPSVYLRTNGSHLTFQRLLDGEVDLIFSAPPSKKQVEAAAQKRLTYEITPFAVEAFVFFVNSRNPVNNLTSEQIRKIYSGEITDWAQISPHYKGRIKAFQRNEVSDSQTMLQKIMNNIPIMEPMTEDRLGDMGSIINDVADYRNYNEALGFTFRYFSTEMFKNGEIKLLAIDGVEPTLENIRNRRYPFITECCIITVKKRDKNTQKIVKFMQSKAGQELTEKTGYTPLLAD